MNLLLASPVSWLTIPRDSMPAASPRVAGELPQVEPPRGAMPILAFFFAATWFVQGAMAAHLPGLLHRAGASATAAIAAVALVGPAQVGARLVEFGLLRSFHPVSSVRIASVLHPIGAVLLVVLGAPGIVAFALLHGAGNGMITIAKGTLPLALFGPQRLRAAQRIAVGAGAGAAVGRAVPVRAAAQPVRGRGGVVVGRGPAYFRLRLAVRAAPDPDAAPAEATPASD